MSTSELLISSGFIKEDKKSKYFKDEDGKYKLKEGEELSKDDAEEEFVELMAPGGGDSVYGKTGYPPPLKAYHLEWEKHELSLEAPYFWILDVLKAAYPIVEKIEDTFAAAENSAFFGMSQQRIGAQQDKISGFLAATGKMIKELFQMVRELRILDERIEYYQTVEKELKKDINQREKGAEVTLKGMFVDLVQGGGKSPASVYGMAQQLEFITLPDLFFDAPPCKDSSEVEAHVNRLAKDFNDNVRRVLLRHLTQFTTWRKRTYDEHKNRQTFMLSYLLQHFEIIQMYITWLKPYLRNVEKLTMKENRLNSPDLIAGFDGTMMDVEVLARESKDGMNGCILASFHYRTRAELKVMQEGYQRGPVQIGKMNFFFRVYCWSDEEVAQYKKMKELEIIEMMGEVSSTVKTAMESLGSDLTKYLEAAKNKAAPVKEEEKVKKKKSFMELFLGDFYTKKEEKTSVKAVKAPSKKELKEAKAKQEKAGLGLAKAAKSTAWNTFKNFKKANRMVQW